MVKPAGAGLVSASPPRPSQVVGQLLPGAGDQIGQAFDLGDGQRDEPWVFGWLIVGAGRWWCEGVGDRAQRGGGDRAGSQGDHRENEVAQQGGVEPDLAVVQAEVVLADLEVFLHRPPTPGDGDQHG